MITEAYVAGLTQDNARMLLDRAAALGLPASVVRTVDGGFIVPGVLVEDAKPSLTGSAARKADEPKRRTPANRKNKAADDDSTAPAVADEE